MSIKNLKKITEPTKDSQKVIAGLKGQVAKLKNKLKISQERVELKDEEISVCIKKVNELSKKAHDLSVQYEIMKKQFQNERVKLIETISKLEHENIQLIQAAKFKRFSIIKWLFKSK